MSASTNVIDPTNLLMIDGPEQGAVDPELADGGLPPAVGVHSYQVFRASRDAADQADGRGWTYHHHVDIACWRGRLYVGWNTCERDEDVWPSREMYSSSVDGVRWEAPRELFPQGTSTPLRMYFFRGTNDCMLAIAGLRIDTSKTSEDLKGGLLVRRICDDHTLGKVYILQNPGNVSTKIPSFDTSGDAPFERACRELLADTVFLEQQDRGRLLGGRAMRWHDAANWPGGVMPGTGNGKWVFGKAFSFLRRPDGTIVGVSKMGWTVASQDEGQTWSEPVVPPTLVTGKAKVWCQHTRDGKYALVYNPSTRQRYPLVVVTGTDGQHFGNMRIVQGEQPIQRYAGADRSVGPQYTRGISHWADDGSRREEQAMWLVYSMSKEDIWVSRVPLPVEADESADVNDTFTGKKSSLARWNVYRPHWCEVSATPDGVTLQDRDPYDYASLTRALRPAKAVAVNVTLAVQALPRDRVELELLSHFGSRRPVRLALLPNGEMVAAGPAGDRAVGRYTPGKDLALAVRVDLANSKWSIAVDGGGAVDLPLGEPADDIARLVIRTGAYRNVGGKQPVPAGSDVPSAPISVTLRRVQVKAE